MSATPRKPPRMSFHDLEEEDSPNVYVRNNGPRIHKTIAHVLLTHKNSMSGDNQTIEIPMTTIPFDLADFASKEELLKNPTLRQLWNSGTIDFVRAADAEEELRSEAGQAERDRIMIARHAASAPRDDNASTFGGATAAGQVKGDVASREMARRTMPNLAAGDIDDSLAGVNASVVSVMTNKDISPEHRLAMLRNLEPIMSDEDRRYVRGQTEDEDIREIVAAPAK